MKSFERISAILCSFNSAEASQRIDALLERTHIPTSSGYKIISDMIAEGLLSRTGRGVVKLGPYSARLLYARFAPTDRLAMPCWRQVPKVPLPLEKHILKGYCSNSLTLSNIKGTAVYPRFCQCLTRSPMAACARTKSDCGFATPEPGRFTYGCIRCPK